MAAACAVAFQRVFPDASVRERLRDEYRRLCVKESCNSLSQAMDLARSLQKEYSREPTKMKRCCFGSKCLRQPHCPYLYNEFWIQQDDKLIYLDPSNPDHIHIEQDKE